MSRLTNGRICDEGWPVLAMAGALTILISFVALPGSIRMLAKSELYRIPVLGLTMRLAEFPSINRHKRNQALADLARARQMMESGIVLWAAPEGTRSRTGELLPFKKGCFHLALDTEAVIVPVAIRGIHKVLPARSWRFNLGQQVSVHIGEPIDAATTFQRRNILLADFPRGILVRRGSVLVDLHGVTRVARCRWRSAVRALLRLGQRSSALRSPTSSSKENGAQARSSLV